MHNYLAIDLGNTDLVIGIYIEKNLIKVSRVGYQDLNLDFYSWIINELEDFKIDKIGLSCVVPSAFDKLKSDCYKICHDIKIINISMAKAIKVNTDRPNELGVDLLLGAYGAIKKYQAPLVVYDFGSATKTTFVDEGNIIEL